MAKAKAKTRRSANSGKRNSFYGKKHSAAWKKAERRRKQGKKNPMHGRKHRRSTIQKMRQAALKRGAK